MAIAGFENISVIGAGQMGSGIAQVCAMHGLNVFLIDTHGPQLEKAKVGIEKSLSKLVEKEKISSDQKADALNRIQMSTIIKDTSSSELVIEAIVENEKIKKDVFAQVDAVTKADTILASNTSSIPITRLASSVKRPDQFIGMHFMNPVPLMKLVEVIRGMPTSDETAQRVLNLAEGLGKEVSVSADYPGFVVNRVLMPMINEAFFALMEGVASADHIDKGMKLGCNLPMGPLTLADFIGLDTCLAIMRVIFEGTGDPKHRPCPLLVNYVEA